MRLHDRLESWFTRRNWSPFGFQQRTWAAYANGQSGLVHAPTGQGKTLAVWLGPVDEYLREHSSEDARPKPAKRDRASAEPLRVLWLTPLRALATDTAESLLEPIRAIDLPWTVEKRTGDTSSSLRAKQRQQLPTGLVTTPESLSILLSYADARTHLSTLRCVIVDEWHELLSTKRGTQTELCLARLRRWNPQLRVWGLSATLGNLDTAARCLMGATDDEPTLIPGTEPKGIEVETILPPDLARFPWAGHLGIKLVHEVIDAIEHAGTTLLFCNTRSQCEIWFNELTKLRPDWIGQVAIHHGSIDRDIRERVEAMLRDPDSRPEGAPMLRCVVCTSSLDLGVDFSPVDQVIQVGSPKGVARLIQRAGRSGHRPGAISKVLCAPAHAFELIEFAAARDAIGAKEIESREPLREPLDVLAQHVVTLSLGEGFRADQLLDEVRTTWAYHNLTEERWNWVLEFAMQGGKALGAYPNFRRVIVGDDGLMKVASPAIARMHRMSIGTITSDATMLVKYQSGKTLGTIEESFIAKISPGDRFVFAGRVVELIRVRDLTAQVRRASSTRGVVPRWGGGRTPLSTLLSARVRAKLNEALTGNAPTDAEMRTITPLLEVQKAWSILPDPTELLIEQHETREGHHLMLFPFEGRLVHEGLGALLAHRIAAARATTLAVTVNDYGLELASPSPIDPHEIDWPTLLSEDNLLDDLLTCLNASELARRRFRDIARIAGLITVGFPGQGKSNRQLQASSELFFDVFTEFDPGNMLLDQARREVLEEQLEVERLRRTLERIGTMQLRIETPPRLTPLAFPLWAEHLRTQHVSSEKWSDRIGRMVMELEEEAEAEVSRD